MAGTVTPHGWHTSRTRFPHGLHSIGTGIPHDCHTNTAAIPHYFHKRYSTETCPNGKREKWHFFGIVRLKECREIKRLTAFGGMAHNPPRRSWFQDGFHQAAPVQRSKKRINRQRSDRQDAPAPHRKQSGVCRDTGNKAASGCDLKTTRFHAIENRNNENNDLVTR